MDSYLQRQISQSNCEITSTCRKISVCVIIRHVNVMHYIESPRLALQDDIYFLSHDVIKSAILDPPSWISIFSQKDLSSFPAK